MPSLYAVTIPPMIRGLKNISAILTYAEEYAEKNGVDSQEYLDGTYDQSQLRNSCPYL
jgi:hypothetical protein